MPSQAGHRSRQHSDDVNPDESNERSEQLRRTRSVRRGVVAAGATGALGAAIAIGTTIHASGATEPGTTDSGTTDRQGLEQGYDDGFDQGEVTQPPQTGQQPQSGQLAAPGGNGPAQGRSGGS